MTQRVEPQQMANALRALAMDSIEKAKSGHPGLPLGAADLATALFTEVLKFNPQDPHWPNRDRFILSAGHGSMLLYGLLYLTGYPQMTIEQLQQFRQFGSKTPGHPEVHHTAGVETTTGPLGQGLATAVGMALGERMLHAQFGDIIDHHTYVLASDGDLMEGLSQEAIAIAGHMKLSRLVVLYDDNGISIDGATSISDNVDQLQRFRSAGWNAKRIDGHDPAVVVAALQEAKKADKPTLIACKTVIGFGAPTRAGTSKAHGEPLGATEIAGARQNLHWPYAPFEVPQEILSAWRDAGKRHEDAYEAWKQRVAGLDDDKRKEFARRQAGEMPARLHEEILKQKKRLAEDEMEVATRKASETALRVLAPLMPELITGSADLTPSNNTKVEATADLSLNDYSGRYIHWGIREHGMAAAVNGLNLYGGFIASGATFLVFSDYCRPALRLSALMSVGSIEVFTHDSIGLGEDGPTHQPIEHLAALRAIPNMCVLRPCDQTETLECWQIALQARNHPSILALTRQNLPRQRNLYVEENLSARGGYELSPALSEAKVSLFASGSEVAIARQAQEQLQAQGIPTRLVSVPSMDLLELQSEEYRRNLIGTALVKVAIEAGIRQGWDRWIGADGLFIGMHGFGASAPYKTLYEHFAITPQAICKAVMDRLAQ